MKKIVLFIFCLIIILGISGCTDNNVDNEEKLKIHVFCQANIYCDNLYNYLDNIELPIIVEKHDVDYEYEYNLMNRVADYFGYDTNNGIGFPFVVINNKSIVGFGDGDKELYYNTIVSERTKEYSYIVEFLQNNNINTNNNTSDNKGNDNLTYNIVSINGIGDTYDGKYGNKIRVDNFKATIDQNSLLNGQLRLDFSGTVTKLSECSIIESCAVTLRVDVYDENNVKVGNNGLSTALSVNETGMISGLLYFTESGYNYTIKVSGE